MKQVERYAAHDTAACAKLLIESEAYKNLLAHMAAQLKAGSLSPEMAKAAKTILTWSQLVQRNYTRYFTARGQ
jgi:hypothetical protein